MSSHRPPYKHGYVKSLAYVIGGALLVFTILYIVKNLFKESFEKPAILDTFFNKSQALDKVKNESKGETQCRDIVSKIFHKPFIKVRPEFLKNNVTGKNLELDIYNDELKLAIEYNGRQHYDHIPFFHKSYEHFRAQKYRDEIKRMLCKQNGIYLIEVRYDCPDVDTFLKLEAQKYRAVKKP